MKINREKERKLKEWIRRLNPEQQFFLTRFTEMETEKALARVLSVVEISLFATLREVFPDLHTNEIFEFIEKYVKEVEGNQKYISCGEGEAKMIKENQVKAENRTLELLNTGLDQKCIVEKLKSEFNNLTPSDIKNIYKRTKDQWVKPTIPAKDYVRPNQLIERPKLTKADKELLEATEEATKPRTPPENVILTTQKPTKKNLFEGLEIMEPIKVKFKGEIITIGPDYIECGEGRFDTIKDLEAYRDEEVKSFMDRIENIKQVVNRFSL